ncbi:hypothetical protein GRH90_13525 [Enterobacteriales bacterium SAP-6]|uniref:Uncharacterized protein n=2 Tax=Acerihabitans arboris TaxID=2691583 RepID=A0A845SLB5_9GAMM|nr:hypothetical protein [Acerihabitans arboris]
MVPEHACFACSFKGTARVYQASMVARARLPQGRPAVIGAGTPTLFGLPPNEPGVSGGGFVSYPMEACFMATSLFHSCAKMSLNSIEVRYV